MKGRHCAVFSLESSQILPRDPSDIFTFQYIVLTKNKTENFKCFPNLMTQISTWKKNSFVINSAFSVLD